MRLESWALAAAIALILATPLHGAMPTYTIDQAVALADAQNPDVVIARKKIEAAHGDLITAKSGFLPFVVTTGLVDKRQQERETRLREEDYNASVRVLQNLYTGGATSSQLAIARLTIEKQEYELQEVANRVAMEVRVAFNDVLLNRAKVSVREDSVRVLEEELKSQQEKLGAGIVGTLNVSRAQVALANERPELVDAQTQLKNSYLRLGELCGIDFQPGAERAPFEISGELRHRAPHYGLTECLARADTNRPEIKAREKDVQIQDRQYTLDQSELRPQVQFFSGYEFYNERDPQVGPEFNHGYLVGVNANWHVFDGFATKGRLQATRARREAAVKALEAARRSVASEVRSAFFDLDQAEHVLETETQNVHTADESLGIAKTNLGAGLGTQLDILQAASDVTKTRTTQLTAVYLHNIALARLARACATQPDDLDFQGSTSRSARKKKKREELQAAETSPTPTSSKVSKR